jgi:predicted nucleic acid-binding protein
MHILHGVWFWDALILPACLDARVDVFYSENVPALTFDTLRVINPFR